MVGYLPSSQADWRSRIFSRRVVKATPFVLAYMYYVYTRNKLVSHDAQMAREFCPSFVRDFKRCEKTRFDCKTEIIALHDCISRFRGLNQIRKDLY